MKNVTVNDVLRLPPFQNVRLVAGQLGLRRVVKRVSILDNPPSSVEIPYQGGDFYLSGLYHARDDEDAMLLFLKYLMGRNASAICVLDEYVRRFPPRVRRFCDDKELPLMLIDKAVPYAEIITAIMEEIIIHQQKNILENKIFSLTQGNLSAQERLAILKELNPHFKGSLIAMYCTPSDPYALPPDRNKDQSQTSGLINRINRNILATALEYKKGILLLVTYSAMSPGDLEKLIQDTLAIIENYVPGSRVGVSDPCSLSNCGLAVNQALTASEFDLSGSASLVFYKNLGILRLLSALEGHPELDRYYHDVFDPIWTYDERNNSQFFETMVAFFDSGRDFKKTADALFLHDNTVRYRISKIKEIAASGISENDFYENVSIALKIHKLKTASRP